VRGRPRRGLEGGPKKTGGAFEAAPRGWPARKGGFAAVHWACLGLLGACLGLLAALLYLLRVGLGLARLCWMVRPVRRIK
jgi:hypothetical protein